MVWFKYNYKNWMHSFEVSLGYESIDQTTFSTWSATTLHWKCTSVNAFIPQWNFKRMHSILKCTISFLQMLFIMEKIPIFIALILVLFYSNFPLKSLQEVARFFNTKHKDHYRIYNLCSKLLIMRRKCK